VEGSSEDVANKRTWLPNNDEDPQAAATEIPNCVQLIGNGAASLVSWRSRPAVESWKVSPIPNDRTVAHNLSVIHMLPSRIVPFRGGEI
jgi:hypothetical protein